MTKRKTTIIFLLLGFSLMLFFGCTKKTAQQSQQPATTPATHAQQPNNPPANPQTDPGKWQALVESFSDLEPYDSGDAACSAYCRKWCPMAVKCNVEMIRKPGGCKRYCYAPCRRGKTPKVLAECLMGAALCRDVKACFDSLGKEQNKSGDKSTQGETGKPEDGA